MGRFVRIVKDFEDNMYSAYQENLGELHVETLETDLVYDYKTKVVYYKFVESIGRKKFAYCTPYISENGKFCRFNICKNRIEEIN